MSTPTATPSTDAINTHSPLAEACQMLCAVLHPGVIGLIGNHHGKAHLDAACLALHKARAALATVETTRQAIADAVRDLRALEAEALERDEYGYLMSRSEVADTVHRIVRKLQPPAAKETP